MCFPLCVSFTFSLVSQSPAKQQQLNARWLAADEQFRTGVKQGVWPHLPSSVLFLPLCAAVICLFLLLFLLPRVRSLLSFLFSSCLSWLIHILFLYSLLLSSSSFHLSRSCLLSPLHLLRKLGRAPLSALLQSPPSRFRRANGPSSSPCCSTTCAHSSKGRDSRSNNRHPLSCGRAPMKLWDMSVNR